MTRRISKEGLALIKQWEGLRREAYCDSAGVWTIGYGHTAAAGAPYPKQGMVLREQEAQALLLQDLHQYEQAVDGLVGVELNDNQFSALVSFCFNVGVDAFERSTLLKKLNQGDYTCVPSELAKWVQAGGKRVVGLVNRRAAEAGLWARGDFVVSNYQTPQVSEKSALLKAGTIAPLIGSLSGLSGFVSGSGPVQWAFALIMILAASVGIFVFLHHEKERRL
ncbi:lysozyme [Bartonella sp. DGB2]|uniref:lysozyme n=1 Tax=Bartonella sp. DGB2 TaxID=3388426 RepID=UPI00398FEE66